jgi:hypothetical protein
MTTRKKKKKKIIRTSVNTKERNDVTQITRLQHLHVDRADGPFVREVCITLREKKTKT